MVQAANAESRFWVQLYLGLGFRVSEVLPTESGAVQYYN